VAKEFLARVVAQAAREGDDFGRALHRGRHAAGSVGQRGRFFNPRTEEFALPGTIGNPTVVALAARSARTRTHENRNRPDALPGAQRRGKGGEVELQRESAGGESQRIDCVELSVGSLGHSRSAMRRWRCLQDVPGSEPVTVGRRQGF